MIKRLRGFSFTELLIALVLVAVVSGALNQILFSSNFNMQYSLLVGQTNNDATVAINSLRRILSNAANELDLVENLENVPYNHNIDYMLGAYSLGDTQSFSGWRYVGCYADSTTAAALGALMSTQVTGVATMGPYACSNGLPAASKANVRLIGLKNSAQCWYQTKIRRAQINTYRNTVDGNCNTPCGAANCTTACANGQYNCGGSSSSAVYEQVLPYIYGYTGGDASGGATIGSDSFAVWYSSNGSDGVTDCLGRSIVANDIVYQKIYVDTDDSLKCSVNNPVGSAAVGGTIAKNVESIQLLYGVDNIGDRVIHTYLPAESITDWSKVLGVKVGILVRTSSEVLNTATNGNYLLLNGATVNKNDRYLHQVFNFSVKLHKAHAKHRTLGLALSDRARSYVTAPAVLAPGLFYFAPYNITTCFGPGGVGITGSANPSPTHVASWAPSSQCYRIGGRCNSTQGTCVPATGVNCAICDSVSNTYGSCYVTRCMGYPARVDTLWGIGLSNGAANVCPSSSNNNFYGYVDYIPNGSCIASSLDGGSSYYSTWVNISPSYSTLGARGGAWSGAAANPLTNMNACYYTGCNNAPPKNVIPRPLYLSGP